MHHFGVMYHFSCNRRIEAVQLGWVDQPSRRSFHHVPQRSLPAWIARNTVGLLLPMTAGSLLQGIGHRFMLYYA